ncbi:MAG: cysteine desulfurase family protein, partial [Bacillus sp. (in: firmicutes)]
SSNYEIGINAKKSIQYARNNLAEFLNAEPEQITFTSGATESNSTAIIGYCLKNKSKNHIITSSIEHPAIMEACKYLQVSHGFDVSYLPVNKDGIVQINHLASLITPKTSLVTVMMVNNEIGSIQPIKKIGALCKALDIYFHCDAVQGAGKLPIDVKELNVNSLSLSAHKIYGPKGVGCLYIEDKNQLYPLLHGGAQEMGFRSGTENVTGIIGFGQAVECLMDHWINDIQHITFLRNKFIGQLNQHLTDWSINGGNTVPSTLSLCIHGIRGEALAYALSQMGVFVSIASACSSSSSKLSHVLKALGKSQEEIRSTIRVSFGRQNTIQEIEKAINILVTTTSKLRSFSPMMVN